jgi:hypothetical protein
LLKLGQCDARPGKKKKKTPTGRIDKGMESKWHVVVLECAYLDFATKALTALRAIYTHTNLARALSTAGRASGK